jgi:hypothetical protein
MTHSQACRPCAKRKVRCDRAEPCSNCKRRKVDRCTYPPSTPSDRIRQLERLVEELNETERSPARVAGVSAGGDEVATVHELRSNDPMMLEVEEDGSMQYLESCVQCQRVPERTTFD